MKARQKVMDERGRILNSVRRTERLPLGRCLEENLEINAVATRLRDEGVIACANNRWGVRGEAPSWGQGLSRTRNRRTKVSSRQIAMPFKANE
jgi:hypothetical protein